MTALLVIGQIGFCVIGVRCLALSQPRNWRRVFAGPPSERGVGWLQGVGWAGVGCSAQLCVIRDGVSFGVLVFGLMFAVASALTALGLAFRPAWFMPERAVVHVFTKAGRAR